MEAKLCLGVVPCSVKLVPQEEKPSSHFFHSVEDGSDLISASREPVNGQARYAVDVARSKVNKGATSAHSLLGTRSSARVVMAPDHARPTPKERNDVLATSFQVIQVSQTVPCASSGHPMKSSR